MIAESTPPPGPASYNAAIAAFLQERLQAKLDKLKADDPQRAEAMASFAHDEWLSSAAKRVAQIQAVTHSLKPIHPDARGTNLYVEPASLPQLASTAPWCLWLMGPDGAAANGTVTALEGRLPAGPVHRA